MPDPNELTVKNNAVKKPFFKYDPLTTMVATAGIFLASQFAALIIVGVYPGLKNWSEQQYYDWITNSTAAQFAIMILVAVFSISLILYLIGRAKVSRARIGLVKPALRDIPYAGVAYGLYFLTYLAVIIVASRLLPGLDTGQEQDLGAFRQAYSTGALAMTFVSLVILPPLWEELLFRGFLFSSLRAKFRLRYAIVITSVIFGIAHLELGNSTSLVWVAAIDTFVLSCFLCLLREKTGSLWPPILLHGIKNSVAFMLLFGSRLF